MNFKALSDLPRLGEDEDLLTQMIMWRQSACAIKEKITFSGNSNDELSHDKDAKLDSSEGRNGVGAKLDSSVGGDGVGTKLDSSVGGDDVGTKLDSSVGGDGVGAELDSSVGGDSAKLVKKKQPKATQPGASTFRQSMYSKFTRVNPIGFCRMFMSTLHSRNREFQYCVAGTQRNFHVYVQGNAYFYLKKLCLTVMHFIDGLDPVSTVVLYVDKDCFLIPDFRGCPNIEALFHYDTLAIYGNLKANDGRFAVSLCALNRIDDESKTNSKIKRTEYALASILLTPCGIRRYAVYSLCDWTNKVSSIDLYDEPAFFRLLPIN